MLISSTRRLAFHHGTVTVNFNCGDDAINNLTADGQDFNYSVRNYGATQRVADDEFGGRQPTIVK
jgi:hypothetical protein